MPRAKQPSSLELLASVSHRVPFRKLALVLLCGLLLFSSLFILMMYGLLTYGTLGIVQLFHSGMYGGKNVVTNIPESCSTNSIGELPGFFDYIKKTGYGMPRVLAVDPERCHIYGVSHSHDFLKMFSSDHTIEQQALDKCNKKLDSLAADRFSLGLGESDQEKSTTNIQNRCVVALKETSWADPNQRPRYYYPLLESHAWWDGNPKVQREVDILESNFELIYKEYQQLLAQNLLRLHPEKLAENNDWKIFTLFSGGFEHSENTEMVPETTRILKSLGDHVENPMSLFYFSILEPGTHVKGHFGPTNTRIRIHLGLDTPSGAAISVNNDKREWRASKCIVFDDSYYHQVWHNGDKPRAVLLVDLWHPDLDDREKELMKNARKFGLSKRREGRRV